MIKPFLLQGHIGTVFLEIDGHFLLALVITVKVVVVANTKYYSMTLSQAV